MSLPKKKSRTSAKTRNSQHEMHTYYSMQFNISEVQRIGYLNNSYVIDQMVPLILEMVAARVSSCGVGGAIYGLVFRLKYIR
jgi:hypothetical protein